MVKTVAAISAFRMPADLIAEGYALRAETDADTDFLLALYASTRERELAMAADWSEEQKQAFVSQQFAAQRHHYRTQIEGCSFDVIERHGVPIGRLYLQQREINLHIVDIVLIPAARGGGFGARMLRALIAAADERGKGVGIFVEKANPAARLYRRLGFVEVQELDFYFEMEFPARANADATIA